MVMAIYQASGKALATAANTNVLELRAPSTDRARLLEIGVFSEAATALNLALFRTTTIGTAGTAVTPEKGSLADGTAAVSVVTGPTGGVLASTALRRVSIAGTTGAGIVWTFVRGETEVIVPLSGSIMLRNDGAVGPAITWYIVWDE